MSHIIVIGDKNIIASFLDYGWITAFKKIGFLANPMTYKIRIKEGKEEDIRRSPGVLNLLLNETIGDCLNCDF